MLLLLLLGCWIAPHLKSAKAAFDLMLLIGAGSGSIFLLRWFWMRINAWTEITGMGVSFAVALVMQFGFPEMPPWKKMMITIGITTASWLAVTLLTKPTDSAVAEKFKSTVRAEGRDVGKGLLLTTLSAMVIFTMIWAVGKVLFR
jgi:Na+/proline symporter